MQRPNSPTRRWFRFSLRTLLVAITIFGLWLGYYINWIHQRRQARKGVEVRGDAWIVRTVNGAETLVKLPPPHPFSWALAVLGEQPVSGMMLSGSEKDASKHALAESYRKLFPEGEVVCHDDEFPPQPGDQNIPVLLMGGEWATTKQLAEQEAAQAE
jgi:hypothetical protein